MMPSNVARLEVAAHTSAPVPPESDLPRELNKVTMPPYRVEPPDILLINAFRVVPRPPYKIEPLDDGSGKVTGLINSRSPWDRCEFVFRNRAFDQTAAGFAAAAQPPFRDGRALMRGLHLGIEGPSLWEKLLLWLRRRRRGPGDEPWGIR